MIRSHLLYLNDILESINRINRYIEGLSFEDFSTTDMVFDAVIRNLEIIGEAASRIPESVQASLPDVPWRRMKDMRNVLSHEYFGVDADIVWKTVTESLPKLLEPISKAMEAEGFHTKK